MSSPSRFLLVTPARNEVACIVSTIRSVIAQSRQPSKWIIVDDGSTDNTRGIVLNEIRIYPFISLISVERNGGRSFGGKAQAFNHAVSSLALDDFSFVGCLDADILLPADYFEVLFSRFDADPKLGISGGAVWEPRREEWISTDQTIESVGGAVQMFRRECFKAIGGYQPLAFGGIDALAEIRAKMRGWRVQKQLDLVVKQSRATGSNDAKGLSIRFREGQRFHSLGYGALLYFIRCVYRMKVGSSPLGSLMAYLGYLDSLFRGRQVLVDDSEARFWRQENWSRIYSKVFADKKRTT